MHAKVLVEPQLSLSIPRQLFWYVLACSYLCLASTKCCSCIHSCKSCIVRIFIHLNTPELSFITVCSRDESHMSSSTHTFNTEVDAFVIFSNQPDMKCEKINNYDSSLTLKNCTNSDTGTVYYCSGYCNAYFIIVCFQCEFNVMVNIHCSNYETTGPSVWCSEYVWWLLDI